MLQLEDVNDVDYKSCDNTEHDDKVKKSSHGTSIKATSQAVV